MTRYTVEGVTAWAVEHPEDVALLLVARAASFGRIRQDLSDSGWRSEGRNLLAHPAGARLRVVTAAGPPAQIAGWQWSIAFDATAGERLGVGGRIAIGILAREWDVPW